MNIEKVFLVSDSSGVICNEQIDQRFLLNNHLLKSHSLLISYLHGVPIPPTFLFLTSYFNVLYDMDETWQLPFMVRMDYKTLPKMKFLGGIPINTVSCIEEVGKFLLNNGFFLLLHPHIDRFKNLRSANIMLKTSEPFVYIETVGKGFDASDLRLGLVEPHQAIRYDLVEEKIEILHTILHKKYEDERYRRAERTAAYEDYIDFVNKKASLATSLSKFHISSTAIHKALCSIPAKYEKISMYQIKELARMSQIIQLFVLPKLPYSRTYVASFSLLPGNKWVLWDIYGQWYER